MKTRKGFSATVGTVMTIVIGIIMLTALVLPFLDTAAESNATTTRLGLPVAGYTGLLLLVAVVFIIGLVKWKSK